MKFNGIPDQGFGLNEDVTNGAIKIGPTPLGVGQLMCLQGILTLMIKDGVRKKILHVYVQAVC
ncbi:hypothetical protein [Desulfosporosinus sp. SB140]|uniref:hypothetical protein n=1 Tax=Desulfosporosinus paludis TaxID=3115649 RepID=UPI00388DE4B7